MTPTCMPRGIVRASRGLGVGLALFCTGGCEDVQRIMDFQQRLASEFNTAGVSVNVTNGIHLSVTFYDDSASAVRPTLDRGRLARRVADYVRDHYPGYSDVQTVSVLFATRKISGPLTVTETTGDYTFTRSELDTPNSSSAGRPKDPEDSAGTVGPP